MPCARGLDRRRLRRATAACQRVDAGDGCDAGAGEHAPHVVASEHVEQAVDVVGLRVREHHQLDRAVVPRQFVAEAAEHGAARAAVDEDVLAVGRLDQDRVALPDVEHGHAQPRRRRRPERRSPRSRRARAPGTRDRGERIAARADVERPRVRRCGRRAGDRSDASATNASAVTPTYVVAAQNDV